MITEKQDPLFGQYAGQTLKRCEGVFKDRGNQYSDTMRECKFLMMKAVAKELGCEIPDEYFRVLCIAGFGDMKYWRLLGGYKEDSIEDGINYSAFVAQEMREIKAELGPKLVLKASATPSEQFGDLIQHRKLQDLEECRKLMEAKSDRRCTLTDHPYSCLCVACQEVRINIVSSGVKYDSK